MVDALEAAHTPPPPSQRIGAIVQTSVFDTVNGIERRYTPYHVDADAPPGASSAAAAVSAAHEALVALLPSQKTMLDERFADSLAQIGGDPESNDQSVARGLAWGRIVADEILAWRATDGFTAVLPPYVAGTGPGAWQRTPPAFAAPAFRQFATMTPFALTSPSQFLPAGPPPLASARYARDFDEVKAFGSATSTVRSPWETQTAVFWQADSPAAMWNRVADDLADRQNTTLSQNARLLALMNVALADATIAIWNAKNTFNTWRPITAIAQAAGDGNPDTSPEAGWTPLIVTPAFQQYPSGHAGVSNAAASVLASFYGDDTAFAVTRPACRESSATSRASRTRSPRSSTRACGAGSTSASPTRTPPPWAPGSQTTSSAPSCCPSTARRWASSAAERRPRKRRTGPAAPAEAPAA